MWILWVPGDLIVYSVPIWLRLPLNHGLSFIWICYLSFLRGDKISEEPSDAEGEHAQRLKQHPSGLSASSAA